jgi:hypothetical protein
MRTRELIFVITYLLSVGYALGQIDDVCTDFNDDTFQGWIPLDNTLAISSPALDTTKYLEITDESGESWIYNQLSYSGDWTKCENGTLCYDFRLYKDHFPDSTGTTGPKNPSISIYQGPDPFNATLRADFIAHQTVTENDYWVHLCAPLGLSNSGNLPANTDGQWKINIGTGNSANDWDNLLLNVSGVAFITEFDPGNGIPDGEDEITGVDNICLQGCSMTPSSEGAYCCDGENLVENGNFEAGNSGFFSSYLASSTVNPGEYDVTSSGSAFGATITDHSFCEDPVLYPNNDMYMVVNGKTQQPSPNSVIWAQAISGLEEGEEYKFCANFKNMPQCTFDILPNIAMVGPGGAIVNQVINTGSGLCAWQNMELTFTAGSTTETVAIYLYETGNGDGNDVAIDDIAVFKIQNPDLSITVQHQGNPQVITASINTIDPSDDEIHGEDCDYFWFVAEVISYPPPVIDWSTFAFGNQTGTPPGSGNNPWQLTTTFPGYGFNTNTLYMVGMYTPACDCYGEGFTYQLTYNNRLAGGILTEDQKQKIIDIILNGYDDLGISDDEPVQNDSLKVYPNPAKNHFTISVLKATMSSIEILSISGIKVFSREMDKGTKEETIDVSNLTSGIYFINVTGENGRNYTAKLMKE